MQLSEVRALADKDMLAVNQIIGQQLDSDVVLIQQLGFYIVNSGGKRVRPLVTALAARAIGYEGDKHLTLAAIIEFIHTATLLHDDVVDASTMRRGKETANALFGNEASVLVGDFLYTRSFQMMVSLERMKIMQVLADATNVIAEGEVQQLMNCNDPDTTEESYMEVIYSKTAKLFEAATQLTAVIADEPDTIEHALKEYGRYLGTAFQLADDLLDYEGDSETIGKNVGDDLAEGKPTLPLIHAIANGNPEQASYIRDVIENGAGLDKLEQVLSIINETGSLAYTRDKAELHAKMAVDALQNLPASDYRTALESLAWLAVRRDS
ncbi:octaprenyl diphosphate synthase [Saccharobesus litoralis]|uniref:Octaprenyl diphosphate synthase n=1 Tax=Saccharobesus litoralis TaxID=2172099 RepID=A0A2S0VWU9_9ALTE|nr:octaprenyl diphosphate synthase [Saccharobesus litoralis]AWB68696.1 octaprenyl diphosphate synthase [Saccharobesus litoralis]